MRVIDLSRTIREDMPVFPGSEQPQLTAVSSWKTDGFRETRLNLYSHTGTHMDAPAHVLPEGKTLDALPAECFIGRGLVIDCRDTVPGGEITLERLRPVWDAVNQSDFLLFCTGWDRFWGSERYLGSYPIISEELCSWIAGTKKALGFDTMSPDPIDSADLPRHRILLSQGTLIIENLHSLHLLGDGLFTFAALPLKYTGADGAPVRAVGILD